MARCSSCSAPLKANTNVCEYCRTRNDIDLHSKYDFSLQDHQSERHCPHCEIPLQTINLEIDGELLIERCEKCFGLFFDPGEIETLMEHSVSSVFNINEKQLRNISTERFQKNQKVKYIKCPVCQSYMQRNAYGHRSGVIIDRCQKHGIWLDSGEITQLLEWKKAGGQILHEKVASNKQQQKKPTRIPSAAEIKSDKLLYSARGDAGVELVDSVIGLLGKLFR